MFDFQIVKQVKEHSLCVFWCLELCISGIVDAVLVPNVFF